MSPCVELNPPRILEILVRDSTMSANHHGPSPRGVLCNAGAGAAAGTSDFFLVPFFGSFFLCLSYNGRERERLCVRVEILVLTWSKCRKLEFLPFLLLFSESKFLDFVVLSCLVVKFWRRGHCCNVRVSVRCDKD